MAKSPSIVFVNANVQWQVLKGSGGAWVGVCDPLKLTVQSHTWGELMEDIAATLDILMKDLLESSELDRFLRDHGWTLDAPIPTGRPARDMKFDVPFIPSMMNNGTARDLHQ